MLVTSIVEQNASIHNAKNASPEPSLAQRHIEMGNVGSYSPLRHVHKEFSSFGMILAWL